MSQYNSGAYSGMTPATPPTEPPALLDEPKSWPKVVGVISIVWASLGLVCNACMAFMPQIMMNVLPDDMKKPPLPPNMTPGIEVYALVGVGMLVSLVLLIGGISLVARKRSARVLHLVWAVVACLLTVLGLYMQWRMNEVMKVWMQQNPDSMWAKQAAQQGAAGNMGFIIGMVFGAVVGFAWPVFCLIWFGLVKRNPAEIDAGVEDSVV